MQAEDRQLSDRERTVLLLAAEGLTDKEIARHLALSKRTIATYWERIRHKLGSFSRTQLVASFLRGAQDEPLHASGYRGLFATWEDGVWILGPNATTIYANRRVASLFGFEQEPFFEQDPTSIMRAETSLDLQAVIEAAQEGPYMVEVSLRRNDGTVHWLRVRASSVHDEREGCRAVVILLSDLTVQKRILQTLDSCQSTLDFVSDHSSDLIARFDADLKCIAVNPTFLQLLGLPEDAVVGRAIHELQKVFQPNERWYRCLRSALETQKVQSFACEFGAIRDDLLTYLLPEPSPNVMPTTILSMTVLQGIPSLRK